MRKLYLVMFITALALVSGFGNASAGDASVSQAGVMYAQNVPEVGPPVLYGQSLNQSTGTAVSPSTGTAVSPSTGTVTSPTPKAVCKSVTIEYPCVKQRCSPNGKCFDVDGRCTRTATNCD